MATLHSILFVTTIVFFFSGVRIGALQLPLSSIHQQQPISSRRQFMNHVLPSSVVAASALVVLTPSSYAASNSDAATVAVAGQKAPTFTLPNSRGEGSTSLDQLVLSKKWTVLYFYPGAFTQGEQLFSLLACLLS